MEHIAALLLIVGCSADLKDCRELPAPVSIFETYEECQAELPFSLSDYEGTKGRVLATCAYVDPAMEEEDAELVWDIGADGTLDATVESAGIVATAADRPQNDVLRR